MHVDEVFLTHNGSYNESQVFGHRIAECFSDKLTGILNRERHLSFFVPVGVNLQFAFANPLGIILNDAFDLKIVVNFEFVQSGPDCK